MLQGRLATDVVADMYAAQAAGKTTTGVNVEMESTETTADMAEV